MRETYDCLKAQRLENQIKTPDDNYRTMEIDIECIKKESFELKRQIMTMEYEREVDQEVLNEHQDNTIHLFDEITQKYKPEVQTCVHSLLNNYVTTTRVGPVIETCLKLVGKIPDRLPSATTINNMNIQILVLAQNKLAESISQKEDTTLETDETSKFGTKFGVYAVWDSEGNPYVLGLRELVTKSGKDTASFQGNIFDLDQRYYTANNLASQNILYNIRNTISDRAATEIKFNELLESYREEVLPHIVRDWNDIHEEDQKVISRLNNFLCGLHSLVHIAEMASKSLLEVEHIHFDGEVPIFNKRFHTKAESGVLRLIRTSCKAFSINGDAQSGCHGPFMTFIKDYLKENGMHSFPLTNFRGNRFNILFHNAGIVYFSHKK